MRALLYYPTINMPVEVLYQGLLYWDRVGSVTPPDYGRLLSRELRCAEDAGLYEAQQLSGDDLTAVAGRFDPEVREIMATRPVDEWSAPSPDNPLAAYLYGPKVSESVLRELQRRGVASAESADGRVAMAPRVFMALLSAAAFTLAERMSPGVDDSSLEPVWMPHTSSRDTRNIAAMRGGLRSVGGDHAAWQVQVGSLLPIPDPSTPVERVLEFRDKHADERLLLASTVDRLLLELRALHSHPRDIHQAAARAIAAALRNLEQAAKAKRITLVRRGLLVGFAMTVGAAGELYDGLGSGLLLGAAPIALAFMGAGPAAATQPGFDYLHSVRAELT